MYPIGIPVWVVMHSLAANSTAARVFAFGCGIDLGDPDDPVAALVADVDFKTLAATGPRTLWERTRRSGRAEKLQVLWFVRIF